MAISIPIHQDIQSAVRIIASGRIVAFPTGTSYGLAADALQGWALQRLRNLKRRPEEKTFTVFMRPELYEDHLILSATEQDILTAMQNQPLTLLVRPKKSLSHLAQDGLVGIRVIDTLIMKELATMADTPLTATSANQSGQPACYDPHEIARVFVNPLPDDALDEDVPRGTSGTTYDLSLGAILDGGKLPSTKPTTIAQITNKGIKLVRLGDISLHSLQSQLT